MGPNQTQALVIVFVRTWLCLIKIGIGRRRRNCCYQLLLLRTFDLTTLQLCKSWENAPAMLPCRLIKMWKPVRVTSRQLTGSVRLRMMCLLFPWCLQPSLSLLSLEYWLWGIGRRVGIRARAWPAAELQVWLSLIHPPRSAQIWTPWSQRYNCLPFFDPIAG